jgi:hypothetical protein
MGSDGLMSKKLAATYSGGKTANGGAAVTDDLGAGREVGEAHAAARFPVTAARRVVADDASEEEHAGEGGVGRGGFEPE